MKRLLLILALALGLTTLAKADIFYGYDGPCEVYFRPGYGYYEMCDSYPFFLGYNWGTWGWRYGFNRTNSWYGNNRYDWRRRWQGNTWSGHGRNWHQQNWRNQPRQQNWQGHQWHGGQGQVPRTQPRASGPRRGGGHQGQHGHGH